MNPADDTFRYYTTYVDSLESLDKQEKEETAKKERKQAEKTTSNTDVKRRSTSDDSSGIKEHQKTATVGSAGSVGHTRLDSVVSATDILGDYTDLEDYDVEQTLPLSLSSGDLSKAALSSSTQSKRETRSIDDYMNELEDNLRQAMEKKKAGGSLFEDSDETASESGVESLKLTGASNGDKEKSESHAKVAEPAQSAKPLKTEPPSASGRPPIPPIHTDMPVISKTPSIPQTPPTVPSHANFPSSAASSDTESWKAPGGENKYGSRFSFMPDDDRGSVLNRNFTNDSAGSLSTGKLDDDYEDDEDDRWIARPTSKEDDFRNNFVRSNTRDTMRTATAGTTASGRTLESMPSVDSYYSPVSAGPHGADKLAPLKEVDNERRSSVDTTESRGAPKSIAASSTSGGRRIGELSADADSSIDDSGIADSSMDDSGIADTSTESKTKDLALSPKSQLSPKSSNLSSQLSPRSQLSPTSGNFSRDSRDISIDSASSKMDHLNINSELSSHRDSTTSTASKGSKASKLTQTTSASLANWKPSPLPLVNQKAIFALPTSAERLDALRKKREELANFDTGLQTFLRERIKRSSGPSLNNTKQKPGAHVKEAYANAGTGRGGGSVSLLTADLTSDIRRAGSVIRAKGGGWLKKKIHFKKSS